MHSCRTLLLCVLFAFALNSCSEQSTNPTASLTIRKNVKDLTAQERKDFVDAILKMKQTPSPYNAAFNYYDQFVSWHREAFDCNIDAAHMGPGFLPWHRQYLHLFEKGLRDVSGKEINLPYWDWTDPASTNAVFHDSLMGGDGDPSLGYALSSGPFKQGSWSFTVIDPPVIAPSQFNFITRRFGSFPGANILPTADQVEYALNRPKYDVAPWEPGSDTALSFRNYLEGWRHCHDTTCTDGWMDLICDGDHRSQMHNLVHLYIGGLINDSTTGTMTLNTSPNDPVFFLHHANVDRMWYLWEERHGLVYEPVTGGPQGMNLRDNMWPWHTLGMNVKPEDMLDVEKVGYTYE